LGESFLGSVSGDFEEWDELLTSIMKSVNFAFTDLETVASSRNEGGRLS
jgi:hypothetical protein